MRRTILSPSYPSVLMQADCVRGQRTHPQVSELSGCDEGQKVLFVPAPHQF